MTVSTPDFDALAVTTRWSRDDWRKAWDVLDPHYRTERYWPALVGMETCFGLEPVRCAAIINTVPPYDDTPDDG